MSGETPLWPSLMDSLWLSLRVAGAAALVAGLVAVPLAWLLSRTRFTGKSLIEALLLVPLVLPPTVVGYGLIVLFGARGVIGGPLRQWLDYTIVFRFEGAVLAAATVALPLFYLPSRAAFAGVDRELEDLATLLGAGRLRTFCHVSLPLARRGLISGAMLAFARALGEFGATMMVFGWQPGRVTLPVAVYAAHEQGETTQAAVAALVLSALSLTIALLYNTSAASRRE